jgi:broad specificity phosphatase PhoE
VTGLLLGSSDVSLLNEDIGPSSLLVDFVLASPLCRARRTAELLFPGAMVAIVPELAERGLGEWELKSWGEVVAGWPDLATRAGADWFGVTPPGAEPWDEFVARLGQVWDGVSRSGTTAIVAHAGVNSVLAHWADGRKIAAFQQDYLEVISLVVSD